MGLDLLKRVLEELADKEGLKEIYIREMAERHVVPFLVDYMECLHGVLGGKGEYTKLDIVGYEVHRCRRGDETTYFLFFGSSTVLVSYNPMVEAWEAIVSV